MIAYIAPLCDMVQSTAWAIQQKEALSNGCSCRMRVGSPHVQNDVATLGSCESERK